jgi:hypothetical protein
MYSVRYSTAHVHMYIIMHVDICSELESFIHVHVYNRYMYDNPRHHTLHSEYMHVHVHVPTVVPSYDVISLVYSSMEFSAV